MELNIPSRTLSRFLSNQSACHNIGEKVTRSQQWRTLASTSLVAFVVIGLTQAFGVFQAHYGRTEAVNEGILRPEDMKERALLSTIGSLGNGGIIAVFAVVYYPHLPKIGKYIRLLCCFGTLLVALGFATASLSRNIGTLVGCQGLLVGLGAGLLVNILAPILPEYFPRRSGLAQGTMYAFAALGGTIWSLVLTQLLEHVGCRKTLGITAGVSFVFLGTASLLALPPRKYEKRSTRIVGWKTFRDPIFSLLAIVNLIHPLTLAIPLTYGPEFAELVGFSITAASQLLAVNSAVGIPSRLGCGALADLFGHQNMLMLATVVYAVAIWALWLPSALRSNADLYIAMAVCHGVISGVFNTVSNSAQKQLFGDEMYYPKNGAMTTIRGVGYVLGVPIAGLLIRRVADEELESRDFMRPIVYTGSLLIISIVCLTIVRVKDAKRNGWKWAR
ncbi:hypothetical protein NX059_008481 [Plenodomus lindquistii]|nr:hypothetical protein NX059_008481 [Plenodomus lindquistii]